MHHDGRLWAITSYFNPCGYKRRLQNYRTFRKRLNVPLVAVELAYGEAFELQYGDAEILVQMRGQDVLWQKERLLNIALKALPDCCRHVAWLDVDVIFANPGWPQEACTLLDRYPFTQLFRCSRDLPMGVVPIDDEPLPLAPVTGQSFGSALAEGLLTPESLAGSARTKDGFVTGFAWVARREVIERHGFYDACIVGGGDKAMICAAYGEIERLTQNQCMNPARAAHYRRWAEPLHRTVAGRIGCAQGEVLHLWHGAPELRRYSTRHRELARFEFDPNVDLAEHENGCWRWNSDKSEMHEYVRQFFASRREDG